jgi:hypothetical protein
MVAVDNLPNSIIIILMRMGGVKRPALMLGISLPGRSIVSSSPPYSFK